MDLIALQGMIIAHTGKVDEPIEMGQGEGYIFGSVRVEEMGPE